MTCVLFGADARSLFRAFAIEGLRLARSAERVLKLRFSVLWTWKRCLKCCESGARSTAPGTG
jgi:hypothetical protein